MSENVKAIYPAMGQVMSNLGAVGKNESVIMNGKKAYAYRSIEDITKNINPLLAQYGIFLLPEVLEHREETHKVVKEGYTKDGKKYTNSRIDTHAVVKMRYHFVSTKDGSKVAAEGVGESMDSSDKAYGKATTYALKNVLADVFVIPVNDPNRDPDAVNNPRQVPAKNHTQPPPKHQNPLDVYRAKLLKALKDKSLQLATIEEKVGKSLADFVIDDYKTASQVIQRISLYTELVTRLGGRGMTVQALEAEHGSSKDWSNDEIKELINHLKGE